MAWRLKHPFIVKCIDNCSPMTWDEQMERLFFVRNPHETTDLTLGNVYEVFEIERCGNYRLIDDTKDDYLFPAYMFEPLENQVFDDELVDKFPFRFGPKLKQSEVLLNDYALGKWYEITIYPWEEDLLLCKEYHEAWEGFYNRYKTIGRLPCQEEIRRFAFELAQHFGIEWEPS